MEKIRKDSRKHPRVAVYLTVGASDSDELKDHSLCSYNISVGGMMIVATPPIRDKSYLRIGDQVTLSFVVSPKDGQFKIPSTIVWLKENVLTPENQEASCIGTQFLNMPDKIQTAISSFLSQGSHPAQRPSQGKKTCRDCAYFKDNPGSKYAFCGLHRITVLNSDADLTLSFNQIYSYPCKDIKIKE